MAGVSFAGAGENLVVNGSFETFAANNANWSGWIGLTELAGWSLSGTIARNTNWFEPHATGYGGVRAAEGRAMLDLGTSPGNVSVSQSVARVEKGATYQLTFAIAEAASGNAVRVSFGGQDLGTFTGGNKQMTTVTLNVKAATDGAVLTFSEVGRVDNTGTYLDNVRLVKTGASDAEVAAARDAEEKALAEKIAAEEAARKAAEEKALAEKLAAEEVARKEAEAKALAEKLAAEEAARKAAEEKALAEKLAAEELARKEAEEKAMAEKLAAVEAARKEAEAKALADRLAAEDTARRVAEEAARKEVEAKALAEKLAAEEAARKAAEDNALKSLETTKTDAVLEGTDASDELWAKAGIKQIIAGSGNDYIVSSKDGAHIDGQEGFNTLSYHDQGGELGVFVDAEMGYAENTFGAVDSFINIQRIIGSFGDDKLIASNAGTVLDGRDGDDTLVSQDGKSLMFGGAGNDILLTGIKTEEFAKGQGDTLVGGQGDDVMDGSGHAFTVVDYGQDGGKQAVSVNMETGLVEDSWGNLDTLKNIGIVKGTSQGDWMKAGDAYVIFDGADGDDVLISGKGASELYGAGGNDTLYGGDAGSSFLEAGSGNDTINVGKSYSVIAFYGADGFDTVNGFKETDSIRLYNSRETAEELVKAATYHMADDGRDGLLFGFGDTKVFLAGVYELKAEQIQFVNV